MVLAYGNAGSDVDIYQGHLARHLVMLIAILIGNADSDIDIPGAACATVTVTPGVIFTHQRQHADITHESADGTQGNADVNQGDADSTFDVLGAACMVITNAKAGYFLDLPGAVCAVVT